MLQPSKKQSVEERAVYLRDPARLGDLASQHDLNQKRLKQERISRFKDSRNHGLKRSNDNDDELSVVSAAKRPKELQGHNGFETAKHWNTPTHQRERRRPMNIYVPECNMNDGGSPTSTIDSPLGETRRQTNTSNITNNYSDSDNDVGE